MMGKFLQRSQLCSQRLGFLGVLAKPVVGIVVLGCFCLFMVYYLWFSPQITLGLIAPLTGDFAVLAGREMINGAELAIKQANQAGGVGDHHYRVKLAIADDQNKPQAIIQAAEKLIHRDRAIALISSPQSSLVSPLAEYLQPFTLPLITAAVNSGATFPKTNIIGIGLDPYTQGSTLATFASQTLKIKSAAILYNPDNFYSRSIVLAFQNTLKQLGGTVMVTEIYYRREQDFRPQFQAIAQQQPDTLLLPNSLPDLISQGQQLQELGLKFSVLGGDSWAGLISANLPLLEEGFFLSPWHPQIPEPKSRQFVQDYTRAYRQPPRPNAALTYDAVQIILGAIASQKTANSEMILQGIKQTQPFSGVTGSIFNFSTSSPSRSVVINQVKNGEAELYQQISPP